jgi:hypothetical protein
MLQWATVNSFSTQKLWPLSLLIGAVLLGACLVSALFISDETVQMIVGDVATTVAGLYGAVACLYAAKVCRPMKGVSRAWGWFAIAMLCWFVGNSIYSYYEIVLGKPPFPSPADIFFFAYYPAFVLGFSRFGNFASASAPARRR